MSADRRGSLEGARAIVLGLGHFGGGLGAARWLCRQGARVTVTDRASAVDLAPAVAQLARLNVDLVLGGHDAVDFAQADLLVVNPAVPLDAPPVQAALEAGVEVTSEMCLLLERWPGPVVGITGSNGKSTTTGLAGAVLTAAGRRVVTGGNLGGSLLDRLDDVIDEGIADGGSVVAVVELSSFMLELMARRGVGPDVAVVTNITPNHLDRHGDMQSYQAAKAAIMHRARYAVLCADDERVRGLEEDFHGQALWYGTRPSAADRKDAAGERAPTDALHLSVGPEGLFDRFGGLVLAHDEIPLQGHMNRLNVAGATLAAAAILCDEVRACRSLPAGLEAYRLPDHHLELVAEVDGVRWIDDSVSTTPESTRASVQAMPAGSILIAGGRDKGLDPAPLAEGARGHTRMVLTIGEQGPELARRLAGAGVPAESVGTVAAAVARAARLARSGDAVLLSPGYSSHDQFTHFADRGAAFAREVGQLGAGRTLAADEAT